MIMKSGAKILRIIEYIAPALKKYGPLVISVFFSFATILFIWLVLYGRAGYSETTLIIGQVSIFMTAMSLAVLFNAYIGKFGLDWRKLVKALAILLASYIVLLIIGFLYDLIFGAKQSLLRESYSLGYLFRNWVLTGFGEELLFAGVIYNLLARKLPAKKTWLGVFIVALLFALWHLPGYLISDRTIGSTIGRMGLNFISWLLLGAIYALSGNLWLVAATHGSMDYPLLPRITQQPVFGLIFMGLIFLGVWLERKYFRGKDQNNAALDPDPDPAASPTE